MVLLSSHLIHVIAELHTQQTKPLHGSSMLKCACHGDLMQNLFKLKRSCAVYICCIHVSASCRARSAASVMWSCKACQHMLVISLVAAMLHAVSCQTDHSMRSSVTAAAPTTTHAALTPNPADSGIGQVTKDHCRSALNVYENARQHR